MACATIITTLFHDEPATLKMLSDAGLSSAFEDGVRVRYGTTVSGLMAYLDPDEDGRVLLIAEDPHLDEFEVSLKQLGAAYTII
jgi:hypothetical protein